VTWVDPFETPSTKAARATVGDRRYYPPGWTPPVPLGLPDAQLPAYWTRPRPPAQPQKPPAAASGSPSAAEPCGHHGAQCAYTGREPDRCPCCHRGWSLITGRDERLAAHHAKPRRTVRRADVVRVEHLDKHGRLS
jgi:hypothetical protein